MKSRFWLAVLAVILTVALLLGCQAQEPAATLPPATASAAEAETSAPASSNGANTAAAPATLYDQTYLQGLSGGFTDTIGQYAQEQGLSEEEFRTLCEKAAADMSADELAKINAIRDQQIVPNADTLMQKVITLYDMEKYLSGEYKTPKGFVSACADVKQYNTTEDMYYGLRLDYEGTYFKPEGESYAVIRFYAANIDQAVIPKSPANGGTIEDPYPFGGAGFTTGTNGRWGSPEWKMDEFTVLNDGAQLFEVAEDGTQTLRAVYVAEAGQFVPVGE